MSRQGVKITVEIEPHLLVPVTSNDGGYISRECNVCDAGPSWANGPDSIRGLGCVEIKKGSGNQLVHKPDCPVGAWLSAQRKKT